jgi:hypothetical protein
MSHDYDRESEIFRCTDPRTYLLSLIANLAEAILRG